LQLYLQICKTKSIPIVTLDTTSQHHLETLKASVKSRQIGLKHISDATGVHISQVSRILAGKVKRASPNVEKLCKFAELADLPQGTIGSEELLWKAVKEVWDGTNEHAAALMSFMAAIGRYQIAIQSSANKTT
jgi:transcriptional regulator with XRE-family HTH domain